MKVNRSYYYSVLKNKQNTVIDFENEWLEKRLIILFKEHRENQGSRRLVHVLQQEGFIVGRYRVRHLMLKNRLEVKQKRRYQNTTDSQHRLMISDNLLDRQFAVGSANQVWTTDVTYIWTAQGWLYLAIVLDLFSRKIIGWSVQDHMRTILCKDALTMAWWRRQQAKSVMHHSDRGSQYASVEYRQLLSEYGMLQSMSRKGNCWDNSPTERVFRTLKSEWLNRFNFKTKEHAKREIWGYIAYYIAEFIPV